MIAAFRLAGALAAHAVWCVADGEMLTPMLGHTDRDGGTHMDRIVMQDLEASVALGRQKLLSNAADADDGVLVFDGRIPIDGKKLDAIILEIRTYFSPRSEATMAIPYRPKQFLRPFRIHKPKLLQWQNCDDFEVSVAVQSFFQGVDGHAKGAAIWNAALDQSI